MEIRNCVAPIEVDDHNGKLQITVRLCRYGVEHRPLLDVVERFSPGCFGEVDFVDDDCRIRSDEHGLIMQTEVSSSRLLSMAGRPVASSIVFRPTLVEWEAREDGVDVRNIKKAELVEVGGADDDTEVEWIDFWRKKRNAGCEAMTLQRGVKTLTTSYRWSPASDAAIRETYNVEAR